MGVISSSFSEFHREFEEDEDGRGSYTMHFNVRTDINTYDGASLIRDAELVLPNPVPKRGDTFLQQQLEDAGAFCRFRSAKMISKEDPTLWLVRARFEPLRDGEDLIHLTEPNPLLWPVKTWMTWKQLQVPIEEARCITDLLDTIGRGPDEAVPGGPIVNACGQQTIDPFMQTIYHPILNIQKNYATEQEIIDMNTVNVGTLNETPFYGVPKHGWKYLISQQQPVKRKYIEGTGLVNYVPGISKFEQNPLLWTRKALNNGMVSFKRDPSTPSLYLLDAASGQKQLFDIMVEDNNGDLVPTSEPLNLNLDGTYAPGTMANSIDYISGIDQDYTQLGLGGGP